MYSSDSEAPNQQQLNLARYKDERASQERYDGLATELSNNIKAVAHSKGIKIRCTTDSGKVNVLSERQALVITLHKDGQYSVQHQTRGGTNFSGSSVPTNTLSKERLMSALNNWMHFPSA